MIEKEIEALNREWKDKFDVTPEFQRFLDSLKKTRIVKCPCCYKTKYISEDVVLVVCRACQIEMEEFEA